MLWGSGRLLLRAIRLARAGGRRRGPLFARRSLTGLVVVGLLLTWLAVGNRPSVPVRSRHWRNGTVDVDAAPDLGLGLTAAGPGAIGNASLAPPRVVYHYSPGTRPAPPAGTRFALLVGINHAQGASPLQGAVTDALNVKQALLGYGFPQQNVRTLLDAQASRAAILQGLDDLVAETPPSGIAVVAIAAHSRRYGGIDQLLAADGLRIDSTEIASRLQRLRARAWIALPTCYAGGYALPGIVGHNRIATFASDGQSESYEVGRAGSYLIIDMVQEAMTERYAPESVESAFYWAKHRLEQTNPNRVPSMSDGIDGDLVLGDMPGAQADGPPPPQAQRQRGQAQTTETDGPPADDPSPTPSSDENGGRNMSLKVCSRNYDYNCPSQ
jgi:hypothetical protein